ncbi:glycosyltransferase [uncultured Bacteroides sp.]|jgi:glycosyltransferase involved in cell wall biosynthesis|uniref:glycosyltransferase family 2 protein n=1 Tax=uncultured Bacteroides sp. TaxID=162156 RepID=UPI002590459B|nr:glycosyltransferase [uncultured Bacteroides sp.]
MENAIILDDTPLVSVVIPCYNSVELRRTLESVCKQTHTCWEAICVDDGSDMELLPIIEALGDPRIFYYRLTEHTNANVARNYGILHSRGAYVAMLDSDDEWLESHLEDSLRILSEGHTDCVYSSLILRGKTDSVFTTRAVNDSETMIDFLLSTGYGAQTSTLVMTASSAKEILWDEKLHRHQDYDFVVRYSRKYRMFPKITPTVIYHCSNTSRTIDFDSCIRFIRSVEDEITDRIYMNYHKHMLRLAVSCNAQEKIVNHYRKAVTHYEYLLPFYDYLLILKPRNKFQAWVLKMKYILGILMVKIG